MKNFFKKHWLKIIFWLFILIWIVHFIINFKLIQNPELIKESWISLFNGYILIITIFLSIIWMMYFVFIMSKDTAITLEWFLLKNITTACFLLIFFIWLHWIIWNLSKEFALTAIGAIIVFWYWYKTYERDKEVEIIEKFSSKYDKEIIKCNDLNYSWLLNLWYEEFFLYSKWYLSEELWKEWDYWIYRDIQEFLAEDHKKHSLKILEWEFVWSLLSLHQLGLKGRKKDTQIIWSNFSYFILNKIESTLLSTDLIKKMYEWDEDLIDSYVSWQEKIRNFTQLITK